MNRYFCVYPIFFFVVVVVKVGNEWIWGGGEGGEGRLDQWDVYETRHLTTAFLAYFIATSQSLNRRPSR